MVCPDKKPEGKFHIYFNDKDMGEIESYIETDEDVRIANLLYSKRLLTPRKIKMVFTAFVFNPLEAIRGPYAVRPLRGEGKLPAVPVGKTK